MCDNKSTGIKTYYHDLPVHLEKEMKGILKTSDLSVLSKGGAETIANFMKEKIAKEKTQFGSLVSSSYFWHIYNALPDFVSAAERHHGYYRDDKKPEERDRLMAYAFYRLNRSPENIRAAYTLAKPMLKNFITRDDLHRIKADEYINTLLYCRKFLTTLKDFDIKLNEIYDQLYEKNGQMKIVKNSAVKEVYDGAYGFSAYDQSEYISKKLGLKEMSPFYGSTALSFWMRRVHEGNSEEIFRILEDLRGIYNIQHI